MSIITEPKKLSMPQQVQKNKEDIESIFKKIDGLDAMDNVVVVPDISYILNADELKSVRQPVAFIVYNNNVYLKRKEESNTAYFDRVFSIALSTVITFNSEEIVVDLTNGALGINNTSVNTYSVSQIDTKFATIAYVDSALASKASLGGANFTGAITAPSIIENMSGYSFTKVADDQYNTTVPLFAGACKNGNKLTLVYFFILNVITARRTFSVGNFYIPTEVGTKLVPVSIGGDTNKLYFNQLWCATSYNAGVATNCWIDKVSNGRIVFSMNSNSLADNTTYVCRFEATFLLSENLAQ